MAGPVPTQTVLALKDSSSCIIKWSCKVVVLRLPVALFDMVTRALYCESTDSYENKEEGHETGFHSFLLIFTCVFATLQHRAWAFISNKLASVLAYWNLYLLLEALNLGLKIPENILSHLACIRLVVCHFLIHGRQFKRALQGPWHMLTVLTLQYLFSSVF